MRRSCPGMRYTWEETDLSVQVRWNKQWRQERWCKPCAVHWKTYNFVFWSWYECAVSSFWYLVIDCAICCIKTSHFIFLASSHDVFIFDIFELKSTFKIRILTAFISKMVLFKAPWQLTFHILGCERILWSYLIVLSAKYVILWNDCNCKKSL